MTNNLLNYCIKQENVESSENPNICSASKIPRPPNAFMLYATENRKVMSHKYPADSNKVISKKLGSNWKNLGAEEKNKYFEKARLIALEHKEKYPHYVYNPKEARLRKAMREAASRDRSIGASPMLPRPNARRAGAAWGTPGPAATVGGVGSINSAPHGPHEEPLIISPLNQGMRGPGLDSPCFPMSNTGINGSEQFMSPSMGPAASAAAAGGYTAKMHQDSPLPPPPAPTPVVHPSYMQTNPLTQLQQQTEMWHNYQEDLRPRSSGNPYMMQDIQSPYHHHQPSPPLSIPSPMMLDQHRHTPISHPIHSINSIPMPMTPPHSSSIMSMTPPHSNENIPPDDQFHLKEKVGSDDGESKHQMESTQPLMENNIQHQSEYGNHVYGPSVNVNHQQQNHRQEFEKLEDMKMKRVPYCICQKNISCKNTLYLPLSCTNFCASPDLYTNNLGYQREYIAKYFHSLPEYEVHNLRAEDGLCFPYASRINFCDDYNFIAEDCPQLSFLKTDVGFIPLTFDANYSDYWSKFKR
ncbi:unnamed protein product [Psylliodes chrysocephalus]|uniref:HMG box domain-containing protein n=1 Tax=Psylliodes chrysocephalus TaxID=3402493 RepID=A0A9P0CW95_9CUCU|nr:unnamed protein product [Psylliodes chrysocephala]